MAVNYRPAAHLNASHRRRKMLRDSPLGHDEEHNHAAPSSRLVAVVATRSSGVSGRSLKRGLPFRQKSVSSDERILSVSVFSPEGGRSVAHGVSRG